MRRTSRSRNCTAPPTIGLQTRSPTKSAWFFQGRIDTVRIFDGDCDEKYETVPREFDPATVVRYRLQGIWYVDKNSSRIKIRLLGIARLVDEREEMGNLRYEHALFWVHYSAARSVLAGKRAYVSGNEASTRSGEDVLKAGSFPVTSSKWATFTIAASRTTSPTAVPDRLPRSGRSANARAGNPIFGATDKYVVNERRRRAGGSLPVS